MFAFEIKNNPEILFNTRLGYLDYIIDGYKFHDDAHLVPDNSIKTTTLEQLPDNVKISSYRNGLTYYTVGDIEFEFKLADRIKSVKECGGWLHLFSDFRLRIENKKIEQFAISTDLLDTYKSIQKPEIEKKFGKADLVKEDYDSQVGELMNTVYHYEKRKIIITFDEWDQKVDLINIGNPIKR